MWLGVMCSWALRAAGYGTPTCRVFRKICQFIVIHFSTERQFKKARVGQAQVMSELLMRVQPEHKEIQS